MIASQFYNLTYFDEYSATLKCQQLVNSIIKAIGDGKLQVDDLLPSINELSFQFEIPGIPRKKGYKDLKGPGNYRDGAGVKGYFINSADVDVTISTDFEAGMVRPR